MELPQYFTGYNAEMLSYKSFRDICFLLQAYGAFNVIETSDCEYPNNYFCALVQDGDSKFYILQNSFVPIAAFAKKVNEEFVFINKPKVKSIVDIQNIEITLVSEAVLNENIQKYHLSQLEQHEKKVVQNWLPATLGGVLFTWSFD